MEGRGLMVVVCRSNTCAYQTRSSIWSRSSNKGNRAGVGIEDVEGRGVITAEEGIVGEGAEMVGGAGDGGEVLERAESWAGVHKSSVMTRYSYMRDGGVGEVSGALRYPWDWLDGRENHHRVMGLGMVHEIPTTQAPLLSPDFKKFNNKLLRSFPASN